jgi:hypothetical protein
LRSFAVGAAPFSAEATFPLLGERALVLLRVWEITVACTTRETKSRLWSPCSSPLTDTTFSLSRLADHGATCACSQVLLCPEDLAGPIIAAFACLFLPLGGNGNRASDVRKNAATSAIVPGRRISSALLVPYRSDRSSPTPRVIRGLPDGMRERLSHSPLSRCEVRSESQLRWWTVTATGIH